MVERNDSLEVLLAATSVDAGGVVVENKPFVNSAIHELEKKLSSATAKLSCQQQQESSYQQQHHQHQVASSSYPSVHQPQQGQQELLQYPHYLSQPHYYQLAPNHQFYEEQSHRVPAEENKLYIASNASSAPQPQQAPTSNECSGLHAILQVIRAEQQHQQQQQDRNRSYDSKHCDLHNATATVSSPPGRAETYPSANQTGSTTQPPKFSAVNFRRVQRHPPVSFPKRPLVTQRSLGSPPSVNVGSSYSPSGSAGSGIAFAAAPPLANGPQQQQQQQPRRRHQHGSRRHEAFVKTRSKTISDFFGPESTPVSRLLNIICQEKEAERVAAHIMNTQQQNSRTAITGKSSASVPSSHGAARVGHSLRPPAVASSQQTVRSRKENIVPQRATSGGATNSGSDTGSTGSAGIVPVPVDPSFAAKDIDRIAKYKADRRKAIYLRTNVHENENERLEPSKSKQQQQQQPLLPPSSKPTSSSSSSSSIRRPHSTGLTVSSSSKTSAGSSAVTKPAPTRPIAHNGASRDRSTGDEKQTNGGAPPGSPNHVATKQIRTTRSSRLRAAAAHDKERSPSSSAAKSSSGSMTLPTIGTSGEDHHRQQQQQQQQQLERSQRAVFHRAPAPPGASTNPTAARTAAMTTRPTLTKHSTSNGPAAVTIRSSKLQPPMASKREPLAKKVLPSDVGKRLVPSIAVNMKQRLKTMTETIKGERVAKPNGQPPVARQSALGKTRTLVEPPVELRTKDLEKPLADRMMSLNLGDKPEQPKPPITTTVLQREGFFERLASNSEVAEVKSVKQQEPDSEPDTVGTPRMRTSTMKRTHSSRSQVVATLPKDINGLSPVKSSVASGTQPAETSKDKSAKRKSFLNRSQTDEPAGGARSGTTSSSSSSSRYQRRLKMPHSSPDMHSSSNRSSPQKSSSSTEKSPTISPRPPSCSSARSSPKHAVASAETVPKAGSSPLRICSRLSTYSSGTATANNSPSPGTQARTSPLSYHMEQTRRELVISPPRTNRLLKIVTESAAAATAAIPTEEKMPAGGSVHREERSESEAVDQPLLVDASSGTVQEEELVEEAGDSEEVAVPIAVGAEDVDEISEEQSSSIGQYSKFSQILKSPTLEVTTISDMLEELAIVDHGAEDEQQEAMEMEDDRELQVPLVMKEAGSREAPVDDMEAGPSGLCTGSNGAMYDDDDEEEDPLERIAVEPPTRGYVAVVDVGEEDDHHHHDEEEMRPANRILFDNQFNDEFVVIENSPKSQLIQSLDEADIIVLRDNDDDEETFSDRPPSRPSSGGYLEKKKKLVKMSSVEHFERKSLSPLRVGKLSTSSSAILRAKSMDESGSSSSAGAGAGTSANHIVSILKRKTVESSAAASSASSNASPVTFSPSVVDTPIRSNRKQGILKKRCSLDESRYSRSHSPDDRSILVKHTRRNSFEDGASSNQQLHQQQAHGILKQKSYESREDVSGGLGATSGGTSRNSLASGSGSGAGTGPSNGSISHGILKKKNDSSSTSTPSEPPKHVSISQAVILAAAEICQDMLLVDEDEAYDIKPILKTDHQAPMTPKPILKKKYSSENEEIRPILKSSRKSSREENSDSEEMKRSILKIDSPAKRTPPRLCHIEAATASGCDTMGGSLVVSTSSSESGTPGALPLVHSRSLEHPDSVAAAPIVPQVTNIEKPIISVAERIRNMEKFLSGGSGPSSSAASSLAKQPGCSSSPALSRRESFRYKTQPVTSTEINSAQQQQQHLSPCGSSSPEECVTSEPYVAGNDDERVAAGSVSKDSADEHAGDPVVSGGAVDQSEEAVSESVNPVPERRIAPEHSCLRSSLELLIGQRGHSNERGENRPFPAVSYGGALVDDRKPSSSSFELLSPTLGTAESNSHSIISGEFNLASLSSDSGVQFGGCRGGTEELSGTTDYVLSSSVKTSDSEKSPSKKTIDDDEEDLNEALLAEEQQLLVVRAEEDDSDDEQQRPGGGHDRSGIPTHLLGSSSDLSDRETASTAAAGPGTGDHQFDEHDTDAGMFGGCVGFGRNSGGGSSGGEDGTDKGLMRRSSSVRAKASMFAQLESKLKENENPLSRPIVPRPRRAQFTTQTISPTDIERSNNAINSGLNSGQYRTASSNISTAYQPAPQPIMNTIPTNNNNIVSDDSGAEFDPSTLQVSKKVKLFSGECVPVKGGEEGDPAMLMAVANGNVTTPVGAVRRKKTLLKVRTIGKLVMPKFLNDSNNNISVQQQQQQHQQQHQQHQQLNNLEYKENGSVNGTGSEGETDLQHIVPKVDRIRRKFMTAASTPTYFNSTANGAQSPLQGRANGDDASDGSDSNVDSGKENNYDSGVEHMNGSGRVGPPQGGGGSSNVLALKRNFLNTSNRSKPPPREKDPTLDVSAELDGVVTKGKVSSLANQWNRLRMTLDVSSILKATGTTFDTPPSPSGGRIGHGLLGERECESLPVACDTERSYVLDSTMERSVSHSNNTSLFSRSFTRKGNGSSKFALVDDRFAKYFGCRRVDANSTAQSTPPAKDAAGKSMTVTRTCSRLERNATTPPIKTSLVVENGCKQPARPRSQSMPQKESTLLEQRLESLISTIAAGGGATGSVWEQCNSSVKLVSTVEELNITTEDLSMADTEFDKLFIEQVSPRKPPTAFLPPNAQKLPFMAELKGGILKSKSGCVGLFPADLNSELKSRLKRSTHSAVSNLKKSTTVSTIDAASPNSSFAGGRSSSESEDDDDDDEDGVAPGKNLAKMLRNVSNTANSGSGGGMPPSYIPLPVPFPRSFAGNDAETQALHRELQSINKNPAVARRRRQNEG
uniref:HP domain-containing protein n=1 Tax=Anopheles dirus TaxID=7168 RepID=A0A182NJX8_9DIPT